MKRIMVLAALLSVYVLSACGSKETSTTQESEVTQSETDASENEDVAANETPEITATDENTNTIPVIADSTCFFNSAQEIIPEVSVMVTGEVVETEGFVYSGDNGETFQVMTLVKVRVEKDYLNQIPSGSEVYFVEPGGIVPTSEIPSQPVKDFNTPDESESGYTQVVYNSTPNSEVGEYVLFFGDIVEEDYYNLNLGEPYYSAIGAEQSRFVLDLDTDEYVRPIDEATGTNAPIIIENDEDVLEDIAERK